MELGTNRSTLGSTVVFAAVFFTSFPVAAAPVLFCPAVFVVDLIAGDVLCWFFKAILGGHLA